MKGIGQNRRVTAVSLSRKLQYIKCFFFLFLTSVFLIDNLSAVIPCSSWGRHVLSLLPLIFPPFSATGCHMLPLWAAWPIRLGSSGWACPGSPAQAESPGSPNPRPISLQILNFKRMAFPPYLQLHPRNWSRDFMRLKKRMFTEENISSTKKQFMWSS